jgi:hypothetical protein
MLFFVKDCLMQETTHITRDESGTDIIRPTDRPTERVRHSNGKTVFESGHLISVTIRTASVSGNSKLNFYDPNMMNITIRQKIYCPYLNPIREFRPRKKNYLYLYPQYPFVSDPFSSLHITHLMLLEKVTIYKYWVTTSESYKMW